MPITTLLWLKNTSTEPLRLRSGLKLKEGKYVKSVTTYDPHNNSVCYHLYPPSKIPPLTEIFVACRSSGGWIPISGIQGYIVYTNRDESLTLNIQFSNHLVGHERKFKVEACYDGDDLLQDEIRGEHFGDIWKVIKTGRKKFGPISHKQMPSQSTVPNIAVNDVRNSNEVRAKLQEIIVPIVLWQGDQIRCMKSTNTMQCKLCMMERKEILHRF